MLIIAHATNMMLPLAMATLLFHALSLLLVMAPSTLATPVPRDDACDLTPHKCIFNVTGYPPITNYTNEVATFVCHCLQEACSYVS